MKPFALLFFAIAASLLSAQTPAIPSELASPSEQPQVQQPHLPPVVPQKYDKADHLSTLLVLEKEKTTNLQFIILSRDYKDTLSQMRSQYAEYEQEINNWIEAVRKENDWDASYNYDRKTDTWTHTVTVQPKPKSVTPSPKPRGVPLPALPALPSVPPQK